MGNGTSNSRIEIEEIQESNSQSTNDLIQNYGLMQTKSPYSTALQVIKPRNLNVVEKKCLEEAAIAGEEFIYQWPVNKKQPDGSFKKVQLIGLSVGAALAIARNMGNNAIDVQLEERPDAYIFYGAYIDLETGFNLRRAFRQRKEQNIGNRMKVDGRAEDIIFQIGQSKAIRNVALNAAPSWLTKKIQDAALSSFAAKVEKEPAKYKTMCITLAKKLFLSLERLELKYGKETSWDVRKIISLLTELRTIEDGYDDAENVFPEVDKSTGETINSKPEPAQEKPAEKKAAPTPEIESASAEDEEEKPEVKAEKKAAEKEGVEPEPEFDKDSPEALIHEGKKTKTKSEYRKFEGSVLSKRLNDFSPKVQKGITAELDKHYSSLK